MIFQPNGDSSGFYLDNQNQKTFIERVDEATAFPQNHVPVIILNNAGLNDSQLLTAMQRLYPAITEAYTGGGLFTAGFKKVPDRIRMSSILPYGFSLN